MQVVAEPSDGIWLWLVGALSLGWLVTIAAWLFSRRDGGDVPSTRTATKVTSARTLLKQLSAACRVDDARRTRDLLLEWAGCQFADDPPPSLGALAGRLSGPLADEIELLESALYGREPGRWQGQRLAELLKTTQSVSLREGNQGQDPLVPLYR